MTVLGLDVSHWNLPDWSYWAARDYIFTFIKCTEGTAWVDPNWKDHHKNAGDHNFYLGPYHYFRAAWGGIEQARHFHNTVKDWAWDMPPAIDVELINNTGFTKEVFAARLRACLLETELLWGKRPVIYTSKSKWEQLVGTVTWASAYDLWVAHYTTVPVPLIPGDWAGKGYKFWQYTSTQLDQNRFDGDLPKFLEYIGATPPPPPPGGGDLEVRVKSLEGKVVSLEALAGRLHEAHHG